MLSIFFAPISLLAACTVLFLIVVPLTLLDDRRRGIKWTRTRELLAVLSGMLILLVSGLVLYSYAVERGL